MLASVASATLLGVDGHDAKEGFFGRSMSSQGIQSPENVGPTLRRALPADEFADGVAGTDDTAGDHARVDAPQVMSAANG